MTVRLTRFRVAGLVAIGVTIVLAVILAQVFFGANHFEGVPDKTFYVSKGETFGAIVDSLSAQGIVRSKKLFKLVARVYGGTEHLQVGKYKFYSGASNSKIYLNLRWGKGSNLISVTVPEGARSRLEARIYAHILGTDSSRFVALVHDTDFARSLGIEAPALEGYLFPQTYEFNWQQDEREIIRRMVGQFQSFYNDSLKERAQEVGLTMNQVLTLASIVEGEAVLPQELPVIAGVYFNRLRRGMKLEADPTIQFILEDGPRRVLYSDLQAENPYNTYRNSGLPPGPVDNPGAAAILATLYPVRHNYLFFVANGHGGHWFSSSYSEHLRHVRMYRRLRGKRTSAVLFGTGARSIEIRCSRNSCT
jgi:UPF0755 protein